MKILDNVSGLLLILALIAAPIAYREGRKSVVPSNEKIETPLKYESVCGTSSAIYWVEGLSDGLPELIPVRKVLGEDKQKAYESFNK